MIEHFSKLSEEESNLMLDAIPLITVLIAGADGKIDKDEKEWAAKITKIRGYSGPEAFTAYYDKVGANFSSRLEELLNSLPNDTGARERVVNDELAKINDILPKLDPKAAYYFHKNFTSFAEHVAKASGGFLGFASISREEQQLIGLPMITPPAKPADLEEDEEV